MKLEELLTKQQISKLESKQYKKDSIIFNEGDECNKIGYIEDGSIEIYTFLKNGVEVNYNAFESGEIFGTNLINATDNTYKGTIKAIENTKVLYINKEMLINLFKTNDKFLNYYLTNQSNETIYLKKRVELLSFDKAEDRLLYFLELNHNEFKYNSISTLAKRLSLERETLSRLITKLVKKKVISKSNNTLRIL